MSKHQRDCSPFGAFAFLRDGKWHHVDRLRECCGAEGAKRARELRGKEFGSWAIQIEKREDGTYYRISPEDLKRKKVEAACLACRMRASIIDSVDKIKVLKLPVMDIVFLIALVQNDAQLQHAEVKKLWEQRHSALAGYLKRMLPEDVRYPFDLFEETS